jgi:hypothetical protein
LKLMMMSMSLMMGGDWWRTYQMRTKRNWQHDWCTIRLLG